MGYWERIAESLRDFWQPGEDFRCLRVVRQEGNRCELCGYSPITWNHVLENMTTGRTISVGRECVSNINIVAAKAGHSARIVYPAELQVVADNINRRKPNTVVVVPFTDFDEPTFDEAEFLKDHPALSIDEDDWTLDDHAPNGMGRDEFDFESFDYEPRE